jgi:hypothetical protein
LLRIAARNDVAVPLAGRLGALKLGELRVGGVDFPAAVLSELPV